MKHIDKIIKRLQNEDVRYTLTNLSQNDLIEMGWYFEEDEDTGNYEIDYFNGEFRLLGNTDRNDCYEIVSDTASFGGLEGLAEVIETGGEFSDVVSWVAEYGQCYLKYHKN